VRLIPGEWDILYLDLGFTKVRRSVGTILTGRFIALLFRVILMLLSMGMKLCWGWALVYNLKEFWIGMFIAGITILCGDGEALFLSP
jgi:hypothetical protein